MRELTASTRSLVPVDILMRDVSRYLAGWGRYFAHGYPRRIFNRADGFVIERLTRHLRRRSQRPFRPPEGTPFLAHLQASGLRLLEPTLGTAGAIQRGSCPLNRRLLCMPWVNSFRESRMREIRMSGLMRGEAAADAAPLLLYKNW